VRRERELDGGGDGSNRAVETQGNRTEGRPDMYLEKLKAIAAIPPLGMSSGDGFGGFAC
jgi:hypothetical protein